MTLKETNAWVQRVEDKQSADHEEIIELKGGQIASDKRQDRHTVDMSEGQERAEKAMDALSLQLAHGFEDVQVKIEESFKIAREHQPTIDYVVEVRARNKMLLNNALKYGTVLAVGGVLSILYQHFTTLPQ